VRRPLKASCGLVHFLQDRIVASQVQVDKSMVRVDLQGSLVLLHGLPILSRQLIDIAQASPHKGVIRRQLHGVLRHVECLGCTALVAIGLREAGVPQGIGRGQLGCS